MCAEYEEKQKKLMGRLTDIHLLQQYLRNSELVQTTFFQTSCEVQKLTLHLELLVKEIIWYDFACGNQKHSLVS